MGNRRWVWVGAAVAVLAVLAFFLFPRHEVRHTPGNRVAKPQDSTHMDVKEAALSLLDENSNIRWELKIQTVQEDSAGMKLTDVKGLYFPEKGKPFVMKAQTGRISKDMTQMTLEGNVQLNQTGYMLRGNRLVWASHAKGFQMFGGIRLESQKMRGEGEKLIADSSLKHVRFEGESQWQAIAAGAGEGKR